MKKFMIIAVAVFLMANFSFSAFGQTITVIDLEYSKKNSTWNKDVTKLWNKHSAQNPYGKLIKLKDVKFEDIVNIYFIKNITKSRKMVTDTATGKKSPAVPNQWMITYKDNGKVVAFVTIDDPTKNGADNSSVAAIMNAGITNGDDENIPNDPKADVIFAPKGEGNISLPDDDF